MTAATDLGRSLPVDPDSSAVMAIAGRTYTIVPQKLGRLRSQLGVIFAALQASGGELDTAKVLEEKPYELLKVFIPDLAPEWELWGAESREAYERGDFSDDAGATFPELHAAFRAALKVNHFDLLGVLGKFFGPSTKELMTRAINVAMAEYLERNLTSSSSPHGAAPLVSVP